MKKWGPTKVEPKSWKKFYLSTLKHLDGIVLNAVNFDYVYKAILNNDINLFDFLIEKFKENQIHELLNYSMYTASGLGKMGFVKYMIERGADNFDKSLINAAEGGDIETVKLLIKEARKRKSPMSIDLALAYASENNHMNVVRYLVNEGAGNFWQAIEFASKKGHNNMVEYLERMKNSNMY